MVFLLWSTTDNTVMFKITLNAHAYHNYDICPAFRFHCLLGLKKKNKCESACMVVYARAFLMQCLICGNKTKQRGRAAAYFREAHSKAL